MPSDSSPVTVRSAVDQLAEELRSGAYVPDGEKLPPGMRPMKWTWVIQTFGGSLLERPVGEISPEMIRAAISAAKLHPGPLTGDFFVQALKVLWNWMTAKDLTDHNPVGDVLDGSDGGEPLERKRGRGRSASKKRSPAKSKAKSKGKTVPEPTPSTDVGAVIPPIAGEETADEEAPAVDAVETTSPEASVATDQIIEAPSSDENAPAEPTVGPLTDPEVSDAPPQEGKTNPDRLRVDAASGETTEPDVDNDGSPFRAALRAAGLKNAEIDGLVWNDFDVEVGHVQVARLCDIQGNWTDLKEPKLVALDDDFQPLLMDALINQEHPILVFPK